MGRSVAVDIGGTFTDLVSTGHGGVRFNKVSTTPADLATGVIEAIRQVSGPDDSLDFFIHGTTAGLNALLERRFSPVGLLTTAGFRDVYEIGRANRPAMYDLYYHRPEPLIPRQFRLEVRERIAADGSVLEPLNEEDVLRAVHEMSAAGIRSIAVAFLHAYKNPTHETRTEELIKSRLSDCHVSLSHRVANEWREFERTSTTAVNAAIAPILDHYLGTLERRLREEQLPVTVHVMQSNGGTTTATRARAQAVSTLLSGPVGGAIATAHLAKRANHDNAIGIDMGGTSFDVCLAVDGKPRMARDATIEGLPLIVPIVDIHTIGAGGGSVAWESAGGLRVGPQSAGAVPGPACYAQGGHEPTVTDANLHLGRIDPAHFLGGRMPLEPELATGALRALGTRLSLDPTRLASGILQIVNLRMSSLIRNLTVGRGLDPRRFVLVAYGGAGPMHAAFLAEELGIETIVVPHSPGTFSAQGMIETDIRHDLVSAFYSEWDRIDEEALKTTFDKLRDQGRVLLAEDGIAAADSVFELSVDLRYVGQEHSLTMPLQRFGPGLLKRFHRQYAREFGHSKPDDMVEVVNLRIVALGRRPHPDRGSRLSPSAGADPYTEGDVVFDDRARRTPRYLRSALGAGQTLSSPCIVDEDSCTTIVPPGWSASVDDLGLLYLNRAPR